MCGFYTIAIFYGSFAAFYPNRYHAFLHLALNFQTFIWDSILSCLGCQQFHQSLIPQTEVSIVIISSRRCNVAITRIRKSVRTESSIKLNLITLIVPTGNTEIPKVVSRIIILGITGVHLLDRSQDSICLIFTPNIIYYLSILAIPHQVLFSRCMVRRQLRAIHPSKYSPLQECQGQHQRWTSIEAFSSEVNRAWVINRKVMRQYNETHVLFNGAT